ncbi:hypothetical protein AV530_000775 [Patagioenas fasciata monilis]|uniref:Uncharacterized protein n=1 Tax=Patagioenas fasciata monilis TaxID=372326 RepID=A0A1V4KS71_PATFA|nr:hypothetical protein AV530_000775 [Patagioenas fasciata monilis]
MSGPRRLTRQDQGQQILGQGSTSACNWESQEPTPPGCSEGQRRSHRQMPPALWCFPQSYSAPEVQQEMGPETASTRGAPPPACGSFQKPLKCK